MTQPVQQFSYELKQCCAYVCNMPRICMDSAHAPMLRKKQSTKSECEVHYLTSFFKYFQLTFANKKPYRV